jgi:hypothetical protein
MRDSAGWGLRTERRGPNEETFQMAKLISDFQDEKWVWALAVDVAGPISLRSGCTRDRSRRVAL